jgi:hypothetical protein
MQEQSEMQSSFNLYELSVCNYCNLGLREYNIY